MKTSNISAGDLKVAKQYWGILAPNDHRKPLFRSSLLLFDQLIIPDSTSIARDLEPQEIDQLETDVAFLCRRGVVQRVHWDQNEFESWCRKISPSNPNEILSKWPNCAARYYMQHKYSGLSVDEKSPVAAFPLYLNHRFFDLLSPNPQAPSADQRLILEVIFPSFPVVSEKLSLDKILSRRESKSFNVCLQRLRSWQMEVLPDLAEELNERKIEKAATAFESYVIQYRNAVREIGIARRNTGVAWAFSVSALLAPKIAPMLLFLLRIWNPKLLSAKDAVTPAWKLLLDEPFAPAGVIHQASQLSEARHI